MTIKLPQINPQQIIGFIVSLVPLLGAFVGAHPGDANVNGSSVNPASLAVHASPSIHSGVQAHDSLTGTKDQVFNEVNAYRKQHGLNPWTRSERIDREAQVHSDKLARTGSTQHANISAGMENVYYSSNNPAAAFNAWKNSPGHDKNMLSNTSEGGLGISRGPNGYYVVLRAE